MKSLELYYTPEQYNPCHLASTVLLAVENVKKSTEICNKYLRNIKKNNILKILESQIILDLLEI